MPRYTRTGKLLNANSSAAIRFFGSVDKVPRRKGVIFIDSEADQKTEKKQPSSTAAINYIPRLQPCVSPDEEENENVFNDMIIEENSFLTIAKQQRRKRRLQNLQLDAVPQKKKRIESNLHRKFDEHTHKLINNLKKKEAKLANDCNMKIEEWQNQLNKAIKECNTMKLKYNEEIQQLKAIYQIIYTKMED